MTPTLVTLYANTSRGRIAAARFRWSRETGVTLEVLDPEWGALAQQYYEDGVPHLRQQRLVPPAEAELFMRMIAQPQHTTYYQFVDESPGS